MYQLTFLDIRSFFIIYSILGWICECLWCSIGAKKFINRGFLFGPWCPIYGFGGIFILTIASPLKAYPILLFLASLLICGILEYFTGWLLETLFKTRWWDYSSKKFNIKGRICLQNLLIFAVLCMAIIYITDPLLRNALSSIDITVHIVIVNILFALMTFDALLSLFSVIKLREKLRSVKFMLNELNQYQDKYSWFDKNDIPKSIVTLREICAKDDSNETAGNILKKIDSFNQYKIGASRMVKAFPTMKPKGLSQELGVLRKEWSVRRRTKKIKRHKVIKGKCQAVIHDAKGAYKNLDFVKLIWFFFIACIAGYVVETIYCIITKGVVESRQGMLYGPFSQVYGFGAIILSLLLTPFTKKSNTWIFGFGAIAGGLFEVICSLVQEVLFGTVSWHYTAKSLGIIGGRTSIIYMLFWGALSLAFLRLIYPNIITLLDKLPKKQSRIFAISIAIFLSLNMLLSSLAVYRWVERIEGAEPNNKIEILLDEKYPNEVMQKIYPNMILPEI